LEEIAILFKDYDSVRPPAGTTADHAYEHDDEKKMGDFTHRERV
jgi:hypothetical protein